MLWRKSQTKVPLASWIRICATKSNRPGEIKDAGDPLIVVCNASPVSFGINDQFSLNTQLNVVPVSKFSAIKSVRGCSEGVAVEVDNVDVAV